MGGISAFIKGTPESSLTPSARETQREDDCVSQEVGASPATEPAGT